MCSYVFLSFIISLPPFPASQPSTHICSQTTTGLRKHSSVHTQQPAGPVREVQIDPYIILDDELKYFYDDVRDVSMNGMHLFSEIDMCHLIYNIDYIDVSFMGIAKVTLFLKKISYFYYCSVR